MFIVSQMQHVAFDRPIHP